MAVERCEQKFKIIITAFTFSCSHTHTQVLNSLRRLQRITVLNRSELNRTHHKAISTFTKDVGVVDVDVGDPGKDEVKICL